MHVFWIAPIGSGCGSYRNYVCRAFSFLCTAQTSGHMRSSGNGESLPRVNPEMRLTQPIFTCAEAALQLFNTRDKRHTDLMRLESLIERFAKSECSELKDRIYGLIGCANDIRPFAGPDDKADYLKSYIDALSSGLEPSNPPLRGIGSLKVDYSCSFSDIWTRVITFVYFQAREFERNVNMQVTAREDHLNVSQPGVIPLLKERQVSIVRLAGIVQAALGERVEDEYVNHNEALVSCGNMQTLVLAKLSKIRTNRNVQLLWLQDI